MIFGERNHERPYYKRESIWGKLYSYKNVFILFFWFKKGYIKVIHETGTISHDRVA